MMRYGSLQAISLFDSFISFEYTKRIGKGNIPQYHLKSNAYGLITIQPKWKDLYDTVRQQAWHEITLKKS